jgi:hypothetical protein
MSYGYHAGRQRLRFFESGRRWIIRFAVIDFVDYNIPKQ